MKRPVVGLAVAICCGDAVLMGKRIGAAGSGTWVFPGGHLEGGETFEDCVIREVEKETGILLEGADFWRVENVFYPDDDHHCVTIFMIAKHPPGQEAITMEPDRCEGWDWFQWDNLPMPLMLGIQQIVDGGWLPDQKGV
jgi:8-oxo-dGTP diphosphatase